MQWIPTTLLSMGGSPQGYLAFPFLSPSSHIFLGITSPLNDQSSISYSPSPTRCQPTLTPLFTSCPIQISQLGSAWEQGIVALKLLMEFSNANCPEHTLIYMFWNTYNSRLLPGTCTPVFQVDFMYWGHLVTDCWVKALWQFITSAQI